MSTINKSPIKEKLANIEYKFCNKTITATNRIHSIGSNDEKQNIIFYTKCTQLITFE